MNENKVLKSGTVLVYLASCSLSGETPKQKIMQEIDGEAIYRLSKFHSMEGICKLAIDRYLKDGGVLSESLELIYPKFKLRYENAVKKLIQSGICKLALLAGRRTLFYDLVLRDIFAVFILFDNIVVLGLKHRL